MTHTELNRKDAQQLIDAINNRPEWEVADWTIVEGDGYVTVDLQVIPATDEQPFGDESRASAMQIIRSHDDGSGVAVETLITEFAEHDIPQRKLEELLKRGEIYQSKDGVIKTV